MKGNRRGDSQKISRLNTEKMARPADSKKIDASAGGSCRSSEVA